MTGFWVADFTTRDFIAGPFATADEARAAKNQAQPAGHGYTVVGFIDAGEQHRSGGVAIPIAGIGGQRATETLAVAG